MCDTTHRVGFKLMDKAILLSPVNFPQPRLEMELISDCAFWAAALFWKHAGGALPLSSGSRSRPLQSCGWWSVPVEGSWERGWAAGTASVGQRARRIGYLSVPQLGGKKKAK